MATLIISDLHLGSGSGVDLLRRPAFRETLIEALSGVDRLVLLGDVLELRHGPMHETLAAAQPFFENLGEALSGRELVLVAGNHDHALIEPWLSARSAEEAQPALDLEQLLAPREASPAYERIAGWASPAITRVAYPGLWVRSDVYATHGHYLDCHLTVPTLERLSIAAMSRLLGRPSGSFRSVGEYEAVGSPLFAWRDAVARDTHTGSALDGLANIKAWSALNSGARRGDGQSGANSSGADRSALRASSGATLRRLRRRALVAAFPLAVAALNRAGLGPFRAEISTVELRRAGLRALDEVAVHLGLGDAHVVFGHTHRAGPLPEDEQSEWHGRAGARLVNTGSWTYTGVFLTSTPGESPYWPGSGVLVGDAGAPVLVRLLQDRTREEIRPVRRSPG
jgi:predicted phosphodiesterase